jgi:hypothetical protein
MKKDAMKIKGGSWSIPKGNFSPTFLMLTGSKVELSAKTHTKTYV